MSRSRKRILNLALLPLALALGVTQARSTDLRPTLAQSVIALQKAPADTVLREKIIKLALEMKPAPAVPEEAKGFMASGTALFTAAKSPEDFKKAAWEFVKATSAAPWLAEAYYNLASAQEKAGFGAEAAESLRLYLLAAPKAPDAKAVAAHLSALQQGLLKQFLADLQKTPTNDALREKIIRLAVVMNPPPAAPEEVAMHEGAAEYAFQHAKTAAGFSDAAKEYEKALLIAPWLAADCFNCGVAYEQAGNPTEAVRSFSLYLLAAPEAKDANDVRKRIGGLKYAAEKATEEARVTAQKNAEEERQKRAAEERQRQNREALAELKRIVDGAEYDVYEASLVPMMEGHRRPTGANEQELPRAKWYGHPNREYGRAFRYVFEEDRVLLCSFFLASGETARDSPDLIGTPHGPTIGDITWESCGVKQAGDPVRPFRVWTKLDETNGDLYYSPDRPLDATYDPRVRYYYVLYKRYR